MNYNREENRGYKQFKEGLRVKCVRNDRHSATRPPVKLTVGNWYKVIKCKKDIHGAIVIDVENDEGIVEQYTSRRFDLDREDVLSQLLD
jgi:hypothetical protein